MQFTYGDGTYSEGHKRFQGQIVLSEHKLFLKSSHEDLTATYIPLEKIEGLKKRFGTLDIFVRPSLAYRYTATMQGNSRKITELTKDIVERRGLKKKFLKNEWFEGPQ